MLKTVRWFSMSRLSTNFSWAAADWRGTAFLSYEFCSQILTVVELLNLLNIGIQHPPMNFVPKRTTCSPICLTRMRELWFFFFSSFYRFWFSRKNLGCAAPDLNHGGKLGTNPFFCLLFLSLFFFRRGGQEIRIFVGDFVCSGLIPPLYPFSMVLPVCIWNLDSANC